MRGVHLTIPTIAAFALVVAACGGSDSGAASAAPDTIDIESVDTAVAETAVSDEPATPEAPASSDATVPTVAPVTVSSTDDEGDAMESGDLCERIRALNDASLATTNNDSGTDEEQLAVFIEFTEALDAVVQVAPDDIATDVSFLLEGLEPLAAFGRDGTAPTAEEIAILDGQAYDEAGNRFEAFALDECEVVME